MIEAVLIGVVAGVFAGLLGIGGGALMVPAFALFLGLSQVEAEATSLLAMVPVALVGAWRQRAYGNVDVRDGVTLGLLSVAGAGAGAVLANTVSERALEIGFAVVLLIVAVELLRRALGMSGEEPAAER